MLSNALRSQFEMEHSSIIVQKFGGTSIGKFPLNIVQKVIQPSTKHHRVIVVCSARSSSSKLDGTTEKLLRAYRSARLPCSSQYEAIIQGIRAEHVQAVQAYVKSPTIARRLIHEILDDCGKILDVLDSVHVIHAVSPETLDCVVSAGENLACRFMSGILQDQGVCSEMVDLSQAFVFPPDQIVNQAFYDELATSMGRLVKDSQATVPVVTGYFGRIPGGLLARIGRGYTDLCASLLTIGLEAEELQVWKEVEGFYTADPRRVPNAKLLSSISPEEASELTFNGSEIVHFLAMGQAVRSKIPIRVKNVMNPSGAGTLVQPMESHSATTQFDRSIEFSSGQSQSPCRILGRQWAKRPAAMTSKHDIVVVNVFSPERSLRPSFFMEVITVLGRWQLAIDLVCTSQVQLSMAIHSQAPAIIDADDDYAIANPNLLEAIEQLRGIGTVKVLSKMAVISLVGRGMRCSAGTAGRVFTVLGDNDVKIQMIAQGASEIGISCVVEEREVNRAMNLLHASLFTE